MRQTLRVLFIPILILYLNTLCAQSGFNRADVDSIPSDLPLPKITFLKNTADGYIFAAVPYWGQGRSYLVVYDNDGKPVFYRRASSTCTDFKMQESGLLTYFDYASKKYYALDSSLSLVDSFWVKSGYTSGKGTLFRTSRMSTLPPTSHSIRTSPTPSPPEAPARPLWACVAGGDPPMAEIHRQR
jgi:hypothetical protein